MTAKTIKPVRCAIYTRVSTDQGLDQDFNSLDAQYEASQAYIKSQVHAGWHLIRSRYDDGGYSGGSTERPALQQLLADIRAKKLDVIVVYKIDRLTRSLADFAKLVELFDAHGVTFVSVTQQFNTTTSMGRLTLNVLLSFAQFEREVTSERIRDKIGASKRKGLWVGGRAPLGYEVKDHKIHVVEEEAERVRTIFKNYLELGSIHRLMPALRKRGIVSKLQRLKTGQMVGGNPFTSGPLSYLLRNRFYIGEVVYKGEILPGEQQPIVDRKLFDTVQAKLAQQQSNYIATRSSSEALLTGKIYDDRGNRMSPSHARKKGVRYRYYISLPLLRGEPDRAGSVHRVPAVEIETTIGVAVRQELKLPGASYSDLIRAHVTRVEVWPDRLVVELRKQPDSQSDDATDDPITLHIPWQKPPSKRRREILLPQSPGFRDIRPIRADARARLVAAMARGQRWVDDLVAGTVPSVEAIASQERCSVRKVNMTISLVFLAPDLVKAAIEGRLPRGLGLARLYDQPAEWSRQRQALGL